MIAFLAVLGSTFIFVFAVALSDTLKYNKYNKKALQASRDYRKRFK